MTFYPFRAGAAVSLLNVWFTAQCFWSNFEILKPFMAEEIACTHRPYDWGQTIDRESEKGTCGGVCISGWMRRQFSFVRVDGNHVVVRDGEDVE